MTHQNKLATARRTGAKNTQFSAICDLLARRGDNGLREVGSCTAR